MGICETFFFAFVQQNPFFFSRPKETATEGHYHSRTHKGSPTNGARSERSPSSGLRAGPVFRVFLDGLGGFPAIGTRLKATA